LLEVSDVSLLKSRGIKSVSLAWMLTMAISGCTTMQPMDGSPTELQRCISSGELLEPGDRVRIVTADQKVHRFAITKIEAGQIVGSKESVPIDQVVYLEKRQFRKPEFPVSFSFDKDIAFDSLIAIAAFALKPSNIYFFDGTIIP
jgi:hypothetical protein